MISIIVPCYNEEDRITPNLKKIVEYFKDREHEIIVVDDGSKDTTTKVVEELKFPNVRVINYKPNRGKGYAIRTGVLAAIGDPILYTDSDLSTPISELEKLEPLLKDYDVIIGSRAVKDSDVQKHQPLYRELMGKTFNKIVQLITIRGIKDTQCGFKLFKADVAKNIFPKLTIERWGFDVEVLVLAKRAKFKIKEQGVIWINDERTKINPIKNAWEMFWEVVKVRWNIIRGVYK